MNLQFPLLSAGKQHRTVNRSIARRLFSSTFFYSCCLLMAFLLSAGFTYYKKWWASTYVNTSTASFPSTPFTGRVVTADFDKDGDEDILYQNGADGTPVLFAASNGNGTFAAAVPQSASPFRNVPAFNIITNSTYVKDFDGDGDKDVWIGIANTTGTYLRNDNGVFSSQSSTAFPAPQFPGRPVAGDFDGDGDADILYQTGADGSPFMYARNNGNASFTIVAQSASPFPAVTLVNMNAAIAIVADFNHDGRQDIWVPAGNATGNYYQNNSGGFSEPSSAGFPAPQFPGRVKVADYDNDDDPDILYQTGVDGSPFGYYQNNGNGTFNNTGIAGSPLNGLTLPNVLGTTYNIVEFDNDGDIDIYVTANGTQGTYFVQQIPQNAGPWIHFESGAHNVNVNEDQPKTITRISFSDADAGSASVTVSFAAPSGTWTATAGNGVTVFGSGSDSIALNGSIAAINAFIANQQVSYQTALNNSTDLLALVYINDNGHTGQGGPKIARSAISMNVQPVNDAPVNTVPGPQQTNINTDLTFNAGNRISIGDVDVVNPAVTELEITLTASNGLISLGSTTGLTFSTGDGVGDVTMTFRGSLNNLNAALLNTIFSPPNGFAGSASFQVTTRDLGNTGSGGILTDSDNFPITVNGPVAPYITGVILPANNTYVAGEPLNFTVNFSEPVNVNTAGGSPYLNIIIGSTTVRATFTGGNGTTALQFRYIVKNGDLDPDGIDLDGQLELNGSTIQDVDGNNAYVVPGNVGNTQGIKVDAVAPTVTFSTTAGNPVNGSFTITITFSESITGFTAGDFAAVNCSFSNLTQVNPETYTVTAIPLAEGPLSISLRAGETQDAAGNGNTASAVLSVVYDNTKPAIAITTTAPDPVKAPFPITITLSENVRDFIASDITVSNGTVSNFVRTDTLIYTALITPDIDGLIAVSVAANKATDGAGNGNTASNTLNRTYDGSGPSVVISTTAVSPVNQPFTIQLAFSEPIIGLATTDLTITNGTASNLQTTDNVTWTVLITPTADGKVTVQLPAATVTDVAGNDNTASLQLTITYDNAVPAVALSKTIGNVTNAPFIITIQFSEVVNGFTVADLALTNATASSLQTTDNKTYTALITPGVDGPVTVNVPVSVVIDVAGNPNTASNTLGVVYDVTKPAIAITSAASDPVAGPFTATFTFSEAVNGFVVSDITVTNGTASNFVTINAQTYTAVITPANSGLVSVSVPANIATDHAGNNNSASNTLSRTYDDAAPSIVISTTAVSPVNQSFTIQLAFSEAVTGFTTSDLNIVNGTVSNLQTGDNITYSALITPTADGPVTVQLPAGSVMDAASNANTISNLLTISYDGTAPTVTLSKAGGAATNAPFTINIQFSEVVNGFLVTDLTVTNGTASNLQTTDNRNFTALITPGVDGPVTVTVPAGVATDQASNPNTASNALSVVYDNTRPVVAITTTATDPVKAPFTITITFSENVSGFTASDITVSNGTVSNFVTVDPHTYTALITPATDGPVSVSVPANTATDAVGNTNTASNTLNRIFDGTAPSVTLSTTAVSPVNQPFTVQLVFSEPVTGLTIGDLTIGNGTASNLQTTDNITYSTLITPTSNGQVTVQLPASTVIDGAGNANSVSNLLTITYDNTAPTVILSKTVGAATNAPFTINIRFSETVNGFLITDLSLTNATAGNLQTTDNKNFTALITPAVDGTVTVRVPAGIATDQATNPNTASAALSILYDITRPTVAISTTASNPIKGPFPITITFSEAVTGFETNDLTVLNGSISNLQTNNNSTFTATVQPAAEGVVSVMVKAAGAADIAGNTNTASATLSRHFDISAPVITVSARNVSIHHVTAPFTVEFRSTEKIQGLTLAEIAVTNGVASNLVKENDFVYTATITPVYAREQLTVQLPAGAVEDLAGNPNAASNKLTVMVFGSARIVKLYPVPTRGPLTILFEGILERKTRIMVMDVAGRIFYTRDYEMTSKQLQLNFSGLMPVGVYHLVVINDGYIDRRNIVIAP